MCGILFELFRNDIASVSQALVSDVARRGPDSLDSVSISLDSLQLKFTASVLSLRGTSVVTQPLFYPPEKPEYVLCWNGEAWRFNGQEFGPDENDTQAIFEKLRSCDGEVQDVLQRIEGPFAFVFYDGPRSKLWSGRDWLGRRSLLRKEDENGLAISSIADPDNPALWSEVEADGFYCIDLSIYNGLFDVQKTPFVQNPESSSQLKLPIPRLNKSIPPSNTPSLSPSSPSVSRIYDLLHDSLRLRVQNIPLHSVPRHTTDPNPAKVGILFSGGIDCTLLARISHDILPLSEPIELLNVAFENKRVLSAAILEAKKSKSPLPSPLDGDGGIYGNCPDRLTGLRSLQELKATCPGREWRMRELNIPYSDVLEHKSKVIKLLHPHDTEMDLSIGLAFYFASKPFNEDSPRTLLSGLGADEVFGGYARHGTGYKRAGYEGLLEELELDLGRLGKRNLGRDDRIIASWGREVRFPFLDERLLGEVVGWRVDEKCGFGGLKGEEEWSGLDEEKSVLRMLAWKLGMKGVAGEKKRAIQFGARTAKMEATKGKVKGTEKISLE